MIAPVSLYFNSFKRAEDKKCSKFNRYNRSQM